MTDRNRKKPSRPRYQQGGQVTKGAYENALREVAKLRGPGAYAADIPMHANNMRRLAQAIGPIAGRTLTSGGLQAAGMANEAIDVLRGFLRRNQQTGWDPTDLVANKVGIEMGLDEVLPLRQKGGKVPAGSGGAKIRVPVKDLLKGYAMGGRVSQQTRGRGGQPLSSNVPPVGNVVGQTVGAINQIQPQTGGMEQAAKGLAAFNPLAGTPGAQQSLGNLINTGAPVDVGPLTQVAQQQAQRGFEDFMGSANEQFGALGLGSSSARTAALAREAGRLQQGVGEQGIILGVGAQEAARGRQLQAFNPLLGASGQQLSGMGQAAGIQGDIAQLGLQGQIAKAGQFGNLSGNLIPPTVGVNQQPQPLQMGPRAMNPALMGGAMPALGRTTRNFAPQRYAAGGRVDLGDFLGNLTFGQQFTRPQARQQMIQPTRGSSGTPMVGRTGGSPGPSQLDNQIALSNHMAKLERQQRLMRTNDIMQRLVNMGGAASAAWGQAPQRGGAATLGLNWGGGHGLLDRGVFHEGGKIDGPAVPPDQVPIMAQGGEGVIPLHLMKKLEQTKSSNPLIKELQQLMDITPPGMHKMPDGSLMSDSQMQRKARGGKIAKVMHEFKAGSLRSGSASGPVVTDRKQAIAIALSEARKEHEMAKGGRVDLGGADFYGLRTKPGRDAQAAAAMATTASGIPTPFALGAVPMGVPGIGDPASILAKRSRMPSFSMGHAHTNWDPTAQREFLWNDPRSGMEALRQREGRFQGLREDPEGFQAGGPVQKPTFREWLSGLAGGVGRGLQYVGRAVTPDVLEDLPGRAEEALPFRLREEPPLPAPPPAPAAPARPPLMPPRPSIPSRLSATPAPEPEGSLSITQGGKPLEHLRPGQETRFGTTRESKGGFSVMGRESDPMERAELEHERRAAIAARLRELAATAPRGTLERLAPEIGRANAAEQAAFDNINTLREQALAGAQVAGTLGLKQAEIESRAATEQGRQRSNLDVANIRGQAQVEAARQRNPFGGAMEGGAGTEGVMAPADLTGLLAIESIEDIDQQLDQMGELPPTPENMSAAQVLLIRLRDEALGGREYEALDLASQQQLLQAMRERYPQLAALSDRAFSGAR